MSANLIAKIFGWIQFAGQLAGQAFTGTMPHGLQWIPFLGSLAVAIGVHAAAEAIPSSATTSK